MYRRARISDVGGVVIPAAYRRELGIQPGDNVILYLENGEVHIITPRRVIEHAQEMVRCYVPEGRSLVDESIAERRAEAERESHGSL